MSCQRCAAGVHSCSALWQLVVKHCCQDTGCSWSDDDGCLVTGCRAARDVAGANAKHNTLVLPDSIQSLLDKLKR